MYDSGQHNYWTRSPKAMSAAMIVLAALSVEAVLFPLMGDAHISIWEGLQLFGSLAAGVVVRRTSVRPAWRRGLALAWCIVGGAPVIAWALPSIAGAVRLPLEVALLCGCRNLMLTSWLGQDSSKRLRTDALLSVFIVVLSSGLSAWSLSTLLIIAYAAIGAAWLMLSSQLIGRHGRQKGWPGAALIFVPLTIVAVTAVAARLPESALGALRGFLPSSGGIRFGSDQSLSGVGDGPDEIPGGTDPKTSGSDQSQIFVNSEKASLYDSFVEAFGEPVKSTDMRKLQFLRRDELSLSGNNAVEDFRAGKRFSLLRKPPASSSAHSKHDADALLYVKGPAPLYLPLYIYDEFDGQSWRQSGSASSQRSFEATGRGPWVRLPANTPPHSRRSAERHEIRIGRFANDRLPLPSNTDQFRLGRVSRSDFFAWAQADIIRVTWPTVPSGAVLETDSILSGRDSLPDVTAIPGKIVASHVMDEVPTEIARLAHEWAGDLPHDWTQVDTIVTHLRTGYTLDRAATGKAAANPISGFLLHTHRGPDDLFAGSAVVLLRALGYQARLLSGFYASPRGYVAKIDQTPLSAADLHFWAEVRTADGKWVTIDPSPGYEVRLAQPSAFGVAARSAWAWCRAHVWQIAALAGVAMILLRLRRRIVDAGLTAAWTLRRWRNEEDRVIATVKLIDRRCHAAGNVRPPGLSPARWFRSTAGRVPAQSSAAVHRWCALADWASYAPRGARRPREIPEQPADLCRQIVRELTISRLKKSSGAYLPRKSP